MGRTTWNGIVTLKSLMTAYNRAKACNEFETGRLNRALGIAMHSVTFLRKNGKEWGARNSANYWHYFTTGRCGCGDRTSVHTGPCKHRIAAMLLTRAKEIDDGKGKDGAVVEVEEVEQGVQGPD